MGRSRRHSRKESERSYEDSKRRYLDRIHRPPGDCIHDPTLTKEQLDKELDEIQAQIRKYHNRRTAS